MENPEKPRGPGRPEGYPGTSMGRYLRERRQKKGWTIRELARRVGLSDSSAGYLSQLETSDKVPHTELAVALTEALGDPKGVFLLWSRIGRKTDPYEAALARRSLAEILMDTSITYDPRFSRPGTSRFEREQQARHAVGPPRFRIDPATTEFSRHAVVLTGRSRQTYRVPILTEGADPKFERDVARADPATEYVRVVLEIDENRLFLPFAYRVTEKSIHRIAAVVKPGDVMVFTQVVSGILEHEIYAIRVDREIQLAHAMWNHHQLLLLPDAGKSDFLVLPANEAQLAYMIAGQMITVVRSGG